MNPGTIGAQVTARYRRLNELAFEARVTTKDQSIRCRVRSDREGRHQLDVLDSDNKLVYRMIQTPADADMIRFEEYCPRTNKQDQYQLPIYLFSYQFDTGRRWDPRLIDPNDIGFDACLFGGYLRSWLGEDSHWSEFFGRTIAAGSYRGVQTLDSDDCHVIATKRPQRAGEEFWIDARTGLVRRWRDPARDRIFNYTSSIITHTHILVKGDD